MSFEFFTRDFPGKKIEWKKFWKGFLWNIEAGFTPALVLHVLYFPLKLSLIVSEEAISSRRRPPPPETKSERSECLFYIVGFFSYKTKKIVPLNPLWIAILKMKVGAAFWKGKINCRLYLVLVHMHGVHLHQLSHHIHF